MHPKSRLSTRRSRTYTIVGTAIMSALSMILDVLPLPRAIWGMKIDLVGVPWVLSFFLYGWKSAIAAASITALYIAMFSSTGYVGAFMKFIATIPMFLIPALMIQLPIFSRKESKAFEKPLTIVSATSIATIARLLIATAVNLYWAIPIWWGITPDQVLVSFGGLIPLITFVASLNVIQGLVDVFVSWTLAFKFRLSQHFGTW